MSEFSLIEQYFNRDKDPLESWVKLGIGDDCALLHTDSQQTLATSTDLLVENIHFFSDAEPYLLGQKSLAVNLSDLAAMGATPLGCVLGIALPKADPVWLEAFSRGFLDLSRHYHCPLIGGDTVRAPQHIAISVTVFGQVPKNQSLRRNHAQPNDDIWVSGILGQAALGLAYLQKKIDLAPDEITRCLASLHNPQPRLALGQALRNVAHSAIDLSDGLVGDLQHILTASNLGATLYANDIPYAEALKNQPIEIKRQFALGGGEDYELCFTAAKTKSHEIIEIAKQLQIPLHKVGHTHHRLGLFWGQPQHEGSEAIEIHSYNHFDLT